MNRNGQVLVSFIIIIPIIIFLLGIVIELSYLSYNKRKIISVTKSIILNCVDSNEKNDIIELYSKNNIKYDTIDIKYDNGITVSLTIKIDSLLGNIVGKDYYLYETSIHGYKDNDIVKYEKG